MKKYLLSFAIVTVGFFSAKSQSIQILDTTGGTPTVAHASYTINIDADSSDSRLFYVKNTTNSSINFQGKSIVIANPSSDVIQYCIGTQCHSAGQALTSNNPIPANGTLTASGLLLDFTDFGGVGNDAKASYTLFNSLNANDSVNIIITYHIIAAAAGIKQNVTNYNVSNIAPNPASNNVSLSYDLKNSNQPATIKIYNMLGTLVKTTPLETYSNNTKIDISSLEEGMYFYSVTVGSKVVKTNRLVVAR
ncbi:MAG: T9SS type A sorting domain-containing protein [Bacteroidia bacterium]